MVGLSLLPTSFLALLLCSSAFSAAPTTPVDPFRAISLQVPKKPEEPICCLKPLPPVEPITEENLLLSFEDWKAKQLSMQVKAKPKAKDKDGAQRNGGATSHGAGMGQNGDSTPDTPASDTQAAASPPHPDGVSATSQDPSDGGNGAAPDEQVSPHFRVPIIDRFNYAALDCSARVHTAHRSAKSPASILSSKRDRYMLSPCAAGEQFVVVELCEDIRIDTVQLANFEFFSGVFKDFTVSVAKRYTTDMEEWTVAGTYRAKNVRAVQSFHPPTTLRDFYRFIRIDFHSHYSNEYYCPISLLRVYGLTHLEQWKWDIWESESRTRLEGESDSSRDDLSPAEVAAAAPEPAQSPTSGESQDAMNVGSVQGGTVHPVVVAVASEAEPTSAPAAAGPSTIIEASSSGVASTSVADLVSHAAPATTLSTDKYDQTASTTVTSQSASGSPSDVETSFSSAHPSAEDKAVSSSPVVFYPSEESVSDESGGVTMSHGTRSSSSVDTLSAILSKIPLLPRVSSNESNTVSNASSATSADQPISWTSVSTAQAGSASSVIVSSTSSPSPSQSAVPHPPPTTGGESIYRTIMNRLTALETNHTLYSRYMGEQSAGIRDALKRLTEDIGRLEGIGKAQSQTHHRTINEWDKQRRRLEAEYNELTARVNHLSDEITLEKRLGIAQLCLLLAVLVFMALTRGSRGEAFVQHNPIPKFAASSMREWGRRNLSLRSLSGDWVTRLRSRSPTPVASRSRLSKESINNVEFPRSTQILASEPESPEDVRPRANQQTESVKRATPAPALRVRTPSLRTPLSRHGSNSNRPTTPTSRPQIARSNSGGPSTLSGGVGPVPRSAKRWARSAHLHEVRSNVRSASKTRRGKDASGSGEAHGANGSAENEGTDVFSTPTRRPTKAADYIGDLAVGPIDRNAFSPAAVTNYRKPLSPLIMRRRTSDTTTDDGLWVDTDADGSELDMSVGSPSSSDIGGHG